MDTKYNKAANVDSGCMANPNVDSLRNTKPIGETSNIFIRVLSGTPDSLKLR